MMDRARRRDRKLTERMRRMGATGDQPRPALGRRPWFALERRARSLRRFFLAIAGARVPPGAASATGGHLVMLAPGWRCGPVTVAATALARRRGLRPRPHGRRLLLRSRSVHGFGMAEELAVVGIGRDERVCAVRVLRPGHMVTIPRSRWILELPRDHPLPAIGEQVRLVRLRLPKWVDPGLSSPDAGPSHSLRDADREPG